MDLSSRTLREGLFDTQIAVPTSFASRPVPNTVSAAIRWHRLLDSAQLLEDQALKGHEEWAAVASDISESNPVGEL